MNKLIDPSPPPLVAAGRDRETLRDIVAHAFGADPSAGGSVVFRTRSVGRMQVVDPRTDAVSGRLVWRPVKSLWFTGHLLVALAGGWLTGSVSNAALAFVLTVLTLCCGHTVGLHRLLVHRSFESPLWLERLLIHLGVVVGMGGPLRILWMHDIRDWAQRQRRCHPFFTNQAGFWRDFVWQNHFEWELDHPPQMRVEERVAGDPWLLWMDRWWMAQQLPWALLCWWLGGAGGVVWGISVRIAVSLTGHWLIGWLAHRVGSRDWHMEGHAVQGYNLPGLGLVTMGECWHNNHHAFPGSAKLGLAAGQTDPGWWFVRVLSAVGLARGIKLPGHLPPRKERLRLRSRRRVRATAVFTL
jgi:fatty-acid desaturase